MDFKVLGKIDGKHRCVCANIIQAFTCHSTQVSFVKSHTRNGKQAFGNPSIRLWNTGRKFSVASTCKNKVPKQVCNLPLRAEVQAM